MKDILRMAQGEKQEEAVIWVIEFGMKMENARPRIRDGPPKQVSYAARSSH
jgi:hypothetical protein